MNKEKIKEFMIDGYGITVFISSLVMIIIVLGLAVMSVIYLIEREILQSVVSAVIAGIFMYYSIILMKQIAIDRGGG